MVLNNSCLVHFIEFIQHLFYAIQPGLQVTRLDALANQVEQQGFIKMID
jgi:hypothetical protein